MGWTETTLPRGQTPLQYLLQNNWNKSWLDERETEVAATAELSETVFIALKVKNPTEIGRFYEATPDGSVTAALVYLIERYGPRFRYKPIDELMGPYSQPAPKAFLEKLTPLALGLMKPEPDYCPIRSARDWRLAKRARAA